MIMHHFEGMVRLSVDERWSLMQRYNERISVVADSSVLVKEHKYYKYLIQEFVEIFIKPDNVKKSSILNTSFKNLLKFSLSQIMSRRGHTKLSSTWNFALYSQAEIRHMHIRYHLMK
jgi:hypothetical protein